jgi:hypothetical protein
MLIIEEDILRESVVNLRCVIETASWPRNTKNTKDLREGQELKTDSILSTPEFEIYK